MTFWLVAIAIILLLILAALRRGNSLKVAQIEVDNERHETELLNAEERREHDTFFAANGYPHRNDESRVAAWGAERGWSPQKARELLVEHEIDKDISRHLDHARAERLATIQNHGWHVAYVALAFTPEQRSGQDFRPLHGMIWKDGEERYFLNLTDMSDFAEGGCSPNFPLQEKSIPQDTFTVEKGQTLEWNDTSRTLGWVDIDCD